MSFAERLILCRMSVHQRGDVVWVSLPVDNQLSFADQFTDPIADHMDAKHTISLRVCEKFHKSVSSLVGFRAPVRRTGHR